MTGAMKAFWRILGYVRPQWPRVTAVVLSAMVVALLLSVSFMTVIPLMKVMISEEGLHGWIDRKSCHYKYGLDFYVPQAAEIIAGRQRAEGLRIARVEQNSLGWTAGLRAGDRIVAVDGESDASRPVTYFRLLQSLATAKDDYVGLAVVADEAEGTAAARTVELHTPYDRSYVEGLGWGRFGRFTLDLKLFAVESAQWAAGFVPRERTAQSRTTATIAIILGIGVLTIIRCGAKFYQAYLAEKVVQVSVNRLRADTFGHVLDMPMGFFARERPSDTVSRIMRDTGVISGAIKVLLGKALREPLNALFMLGCAALISWQLTLVFLCAAPLVVGLLSIFGRKMKKATRKSLAAGSVMLGRLQQTLEGLGVVKVYNRQGYERRAFHEINRRLLKQLLRIAKVDAATMPVLEVLGMIGGGLALVIGVQWVGRSQMDASEFLGLLILMGASAESVRKASGIWNRVQQANAAAERVFAIMDQPKETDFQGTIVLGPLRRRIEFVDVVFSYPGSDEPALKGINLSVPAGRTVAIVGPNGSGKTTLANLIPRFYDPDSGRVLIDDTDIRDVTLASLRDQIAMVTQNIVTFNDTIMANIAYGKADATEQEVIAAAKRAYAHEFISLLPGGYDTVIGEQGVGLSGGQLQRIIIARAILKDPSILIFDEATSQVDPDSEAKIHRAIEQIMRDRTSFIIAHRFSTIVAADAIVVMDGGRVIDQGRHDELARRCPLYQSLYETQLVRT